MATIDLFNAQSVDPLSKVFYLDGQITLVATGLMPNDEITFEMVRLVASGCPPTLPLNQCADAIGQTTPLTCYDGTKIKLTAAHSTVILDNPLNANIRAIFTGIRVGSINLTYSRTDTENVTDFMRGCKNCCPVSAAVGAIPIFANDGVTVLFRAFPP